MPCIRTLRCAGEFLRSAKGAARHPPVGLGTVSRCTPFCASSSRAQRVRRGTLQSGQEPIAPHSVFARVPQERKGCGAAPSSRVRNPSRRTPFCASSSRAQRVRRGTLQSGQEPIAPHSVLREFLKSAKGAARHPPVGSGTHRAALRFARVPQERKGCGAAPSSRVRNPSRRTPFLREFLKSAKGAARHPPVGSRNPSRRTPFLREFLKSAKGAARHPPVGSGTHRAALRFARVPQKAATCGRKTC